MISSRRSKTNGVSLAESLAKMTVDDFKADAPSSTFDELMKGVSTSCKALGHSPEATTFVRRDMFALVDQVALNNLFLTISPCEEFLFRVPDF